MLYLPSLLTLHFGLQTVNSLHSVSFTMRPNIQQPQKKKIYLFKIDSRRWKKFFVGETGFDVNYISDTVFVRFSQFLPGRINVSGLDDLNIWQQIVLLAKLKTISRTLDASNKRACNRLPMHHQRYLRNTVWFSDQTKLNQNSIASQKSQIM